MTEQTRRDENGGQPEKPNMSYSRRFQLAKLAAGVAVAVAALSQPAAAAEAGSSLCDNSLIGLLQQWFLFSPAMAVLLGVAFYQMENLMKIIKRKPAAREELKQRQAQIKQGVLVVLLSGPGAALFIVIFDLPIADCIVQMFNIL